MGGPAEFSGDQLRTIVERIEHIKEEIKELNEGKREIFQEAKSNGFDVKVIREIVRLRKQDQKEREEHESLLEVYLRAIKDTRVAKAACRGGLIRASSARRGACYANTANNAPVGLHSLTGAFC